MKLLLTSSGFSDESAFNVLRECISHFVSPRMVVLYTIREPGDEIWLANYEKELNPLGISYDFINISEEKDLSDKNFYDIYYVAGGNTFYILDRLKKTGLFEVLKESIEKDKLYIGLSAGSIIAGPDIEISGYGPSGDQNDIQIKDFSALGAVSFHVYPHYHTHEEQIVRDFYKNQNKPVVALADGQAIVVVNNEFRLLGSGLGFKLGLE